MGKRCCRSAVVTSYSDITSADVSRDVDRMRQSFSLPFHADTHMDVLQALWAAAHAARPDELTHALEGTTSPCPAFPGPHSDEWKHLGFQRNEPESDVRSAGVFGLRVVVRALQMQPQLGAGVWQSDVGYPWAASALDVVFMLAAALKLLPKPASYCPAIGTAISQADAHGPRLDIVGFARWAHADAAGPEAVFQTVCNAALLEMHVQWSELQDKVHGTTANSVLSPLHASRASSREPQQQQGRQPQPEVALLFFRNALQAVRQATLAALAAGEGPGGDFLAAVRRHGAVAATEVYEHVGLNRAVSKSKRAVVPANSGTVHAR